MATSAIGPGFLTQTTVFTEKLLYNFGLVIILSILIDIVAQMTIWRVLTFSNLKAQQLGNMLFPKLGTGLALAVAFGGLVFNIGNSAGTGMGINAMFDIPNSYGTLISALIVIYLFYAEDSLKKLDFFIKILAIVMLFLIVFMLFNLNLDFKKLLINSFFPEKFDLKATITLVGGTVGGYITFAGAQRLMDAGIVGPENTKMVSQSATFGVAFTGILRYLLFVGTLSIVLTGISLDQNNPTASVFESVFGQYGKKMFGLMIWSASITSVIGATYTSISFLKDLHPTFELNKKNWAIVFVLTSVIINLYFGKPVNLLLFAGYINGFILPLGLVIVLISLSRNTIFKEYKHPLWLTISAWFVVFLLIYFVVKSLFQ